MYTDTKSNLDATFNKDNNVKNVVPTDVPLKDDGDEKKLQRKKNSLTIHNGKTGIYLENGEVVKVFKRPDDKKDTSVDSSQGSVDSLDRISSLSSSSMGSNRILNMSEVDALIEMQERCK